MRIQQSSHQGCAVLTVAGRLDVAAAPQLQGDLDPLCAGVFTAIRHPALGWPGSALTLCQERPALGPKPAALVASELVPNAVVQARTELELLVELRDARLQVAVRDQDPNLARILAAKDGIGRGLGLVIVERVATAWGCARRGLAARSSVARWTCHHRNPTLRAATCSRRPIPAPPP